MRVGYIIFCAAAPEAPPDIIVPENDVCWANAVWTEHNGGELHPARWQGGKNEQALLRAVRWLVGLYTEHQKSLVRQSNIERLQWDYTTYLGPTLGLELIVSSERAAPDSAVNLDILLPLDISDRTMAHARVVAGLPPKLSAPGLSPPSYSDIALVEPSVPRAKLPRLRAVLHYQGGVDNTVTASLLEMIWPAETEEPVWQAIAEMFSPPPWSPGDGCLTNYVAECTSALSALCSDLGRKKEARLGLVEELAKLLGSPAEVTLSCPEMGVATFLIAHSGRVTDDDSVVAMAHCYTAVLIVRIPADFPDKAPPLLLSDTAVQQKPQGAGRAAAGAALVAGGGGPIHLVYGEGEYPYSPRWAPLELATRIHVFVYDTALPALQSKCSVARG